MSKIVEKIILLLIRPCTVWHFQAELIHTLYGEKDNTEAIHVSTYVMLDLNLPPTRRALILLDLKVPSPRLMWMIVTRGMSFKSIRRFPRFVGWVSPGHRKSRAAFSNFTLHVTIHLSRFAIWKLSVFENKTRTRRVNPYITTTSLCPLSFQEG